MKKTKFFVLLIIFLSACIQTNEKGSFNIEDDVVNNEEYERTDVADENTEIVQASEINEYNCDITPREREFDVATYYEGSLIDDHLHMPSLFSVPEQFKAVLPWNVPVLEKDVAIDEIICLMDKEGITQAIGFYPILQSLAKPSIATIKRIEERHPNRIIAFLQPAPISMPIFEPEVLDEVMTSNQDVFKGYGELGTYLGVFQGTNPDDPKFLESYRIAGKHKLIVMIHPMPYNIDAVERAIKQNPNVTFLLHGDEAEVQMMSVIENNDNAYYSLDAALFPKSVYYFKSKEEFVDHFKKNFYNDLNESIAEWKPRIESNPDKIMWGTDRLEKWHFDDEVSGIIEEFSRSFIGSLDPRVQEKFAYKNAERMLEDVKK
ncbi:MAG TPA: hypothetical protein VFF13_02995 [archaeon]|nr:hypothetical protein [archaeon]